MSAAARLCETNQLTLPTRSDDPLSREKTRETSRLVRIVGSNVDRDERDRAKRVKEGRENERRRDSKLCVFLRPLADNSGSKWMKELGKRGEEGG